MLMSSTVFTENTPIHGKQECGKVDVAYWKENVAKEKATISWQFELVGSRRQRKRGQCDHGIPSSPLLPIGRQMGRSVNYVSTA